jgi:hypothetical protein
MSGGSGDGIIQLSIGIESGAVLAGFFNELMNISEPKADNFADLSAIYDSVIS